MLGRAAMLLFFDIAPEAIAEHDDWHTHEHLPERLSIPGFLRGTRWVGLRGGQSRYFVIYEVRDTGVLTSAAYLERLNNPTPWTQKMMPSYRGMTRGFCAVTGSAGLGMGHAALVVRFKPGDAAPLRDWLVKEVIPGLATRPGLGGCFLFESAVAPPMTREQRIRGADAGVDWALVVTGYDEETVAGVERADLAKTRLEGRGAAIAGFGLYRTHYTLYEAEAKRS
ncbi:MAG TPA: hypothetical protein VLA30_05400 [Burkholderiales bacterium]|nr:hypothetical protein [Burkholderiales bacterium]